MKKTLLFICSFFVYSMGYLTYGQSFHKKEPKYIIYKNNMNSPLTKKEIEQLKEVYEKEYTSFVLNNPHHLKFLKNILRNRIEIKELRDYPKKTKLLSEVAVFDKYNSKLKRKRFDKDNFNPLSYNFDFYAKSMQIYKVDNTNYYIFIKSQYLN